MSKATVCRSCRQRVLWTVTVKEKRMPVDPEPVLNGNIVLRDRPGLAPRAYSVTPKPDVKAYISHFATCPQAKKWSKRKGGKKK